MPDWKRPRGGPPKTWLKQITVDIDTIDALNWLVTTDRPTWRAR